MPTIIPYSTSEEELVPLERVQERGVCATYCDGNSLDPQSLNMARLPTLLNRRLQDKVTIM